MESEGLVTVRGSEDPVTVRESEGPVTLREADITFRESEDTVKVR